MSDYSQGKIYLIYLPELEEYGYIGSTIKELPRRLWEHRYQKTSNQPYQFASCVFFQEGNEVCIKLLEAFPCQTKQELLAREKYWLDKYPEAVNKNPPILTEEQRIARHKELHLIAYNKNKEHNLAKHREWLEKNKDYHSQQRAQHRLENPEETKAKDKEANAKRDKEKRNAWKNQKVICSECQLVLSRNNFPTHKKNKHEGKGEYTVKE